MSISQIRQRLEGKPFQRLTHALKLRTITAEELHELEETFFELHTAMDRLKSRCREEAKTDPVVRRVAQLENLSENVGFTAIFLGTPALIACIVYYGLYRIYSPSLIVTVVILYPVTAFALMIWSSMSLVNLLGPFPAWMDRTPINGVHPGDAIRGEQAYAVALGPVLGRYRQNQGELADINRDLEAYKLQLHTDKLAKFASFKLSWSEVGTMTNAEHLDIANTQARRLEILLSDKFLPEKERIHDMLDEISDLLPEAMIRKARFVATMRNRLVHEYEFRELPDLESFIDQSQSLLLYLLTLPDMPITEEVQAYLDAMENSHGSSAEDYDPNWLANQIRTGRIASAEWHRTEQQFIVDASKHLERILRLRFDSSGGTGLKTTLRNTRLLKNSYLLKDLEHLASLRNDFFHHPFEFGPDEYQEFRSLAENVSQRLQIEKPQQAYYG